jgi:hypothetical protein
VLGAPVSCSMRHDRDEARGGHAPTCTRLQPRPEHRSRLRVAAGASSQPGSGQADGRRVGARSTDSFRTTGALTVGAELEHQLRLDLRPGRRARSPTTSPTTRLYTATAARPVFGSVSARPASTVATQRARRGLANGKSDATAASSGPSRWSGACGREGRWSAA